MTSRRFARLPRVLLAIGLLASALAAATLASSSPRPTQAAVADCLDPRHGNALSVWYWTATVTGGGPGVVGAGYMYVLQTDTARGADLIAITGLLGHDYSGHSLLAGDTVIVLASTGESGSDDTFQAFIRMSSNGFSSFVGNNVGQYGGNRVINATLVSCNSNLLANPSLESGQLMPLGPSGWTSQKPAGASPWWPDTSGHTAWPADSHTGRRGVETSNEILDGSCTERIGAWWSSTLIPVSPSHIYAWGGWTDGPYNLVWLEFYDANQQPFMGTGLRSLAPGPWAAVLGSYSVLPPGTAYLRIVLNNVDDDPAGCADGETVYGLYDDLFLVDMGVSPSLSISAVPQAEEGMRFVFPPGVKP